MPEELPFFMEDKRIAESLKKVNGCVPDNCELFLTGGTTRNAVYYSMFGEKLTQRDYDMNFIGKGWKEFSECLRFEKGFEYGKIKREHQIVFRKPLVENAEPYEDYIYLDVHFYEDRDIKEIIEKEINFSISSFCLNIKFINESEWKENLISLPKAFEDIREKRLRLNPHNEDLYEKTLFSCVRYMSLGFKAPPRDQVKRMFSALKKIESKEEFERGKKKVFDYVGGRERAIELAKELEIEKDIFNFEAIKTSGG